MPGARFVLCRREPMAVGWSCFCSPFEDGFLWSFDLADIGWYLQKCQLVLDRWQQEIPDQTVSVDLQALVGDPAPVLQQVCAVIDVPYTEKMLSFQKNKSPVATFSQKQIRGKLQPSMQEKWRRYETYLEPLALAISED
jgi:hypothetical protein